MTMITSGERYHIHVDAEEIDAELSCSLLKDRGFSEKNFIRDGSRGSEYSPHLHVTKKYWDRRTFDADFDFILAEIAAGRRLEGYVEGEFIALDRQFANFRREVIPRPPFRVELGPLPTGTFRQTELHLTASSSESDPDVLDVLFDMGFFCAYAMKDYGRAQIFTMQGSVRNIASITPKLISFIEEGGLARATLKEERIVRWWVSGPSIVLPPVIAQIYDFAKAPGGRPTMEEEKSLTA